MGLRVSMLRGALVIVVILLVLVLAGCARGEEEGNDGPVPSSLEEADELVVRVSGAQDTAYVGNYGTLGGEPQIVEGTLEAEPQEYEVETEGVRADGVSASFRKIEADSGELKAEIVADDVVVAESRTRVPPGTVIVEWIPEGLFQEEGVPEEEHTH